MDPTQQAMRRQLLLALTGLLPVACAMPVRQPAGEALAPPQRAVRAAAIGQRWEYRVVNVYNGLTVDQFAETVVAADAQVRIRRSGSSAPPQPDEIHSPWGMIACDPHWDPPITFTRPIPAWPQDLASGSVQTYDRHYREFANPDSPLWWSQRMRPVAWEEISVPAGNFIALRYENQISFDSGDFYRLASARDETVWLCPQVGRWVKRRSRGTYFLPGPGGCEMFEDYRQEDLMAWQ